MERRKVRNAKKMINGFKIGETVYYALFGQDPETAENTVVAWDKIAFHWSIEGSAGQVPEWVLANGVPVQCVEDGDLGWISACQLGRTRDEAIIRRAW